LIQLRIKLTGLQKRLLTFEEVDSGLTSKFLTPEVGSQPFEQIKDRYEQSVE
jgi:hypothetical protein